MNHFALEDGLLHGEGVSLTALADQVGTPCYVYSRATLVRHYQVMDRALAGVPHVICYSVKANSNLAVLQLLAGLGSGFDIVSVGELRRVLQAGGDPTKVVFSGVGKRADEIAAALEAGIASINIESAHELAMIERVAAASGHLAPISVRVNPDVDAKTHAYIATGLKSSKFGVPVQEAFDLYLRAHRSTHIRVVGVDCHIGSQIVEVAPLVEAMDRMLALIDRLQDHGIRIGHLDMGGGLGITYKDEKPAPPRELGQAYAARLAPRGIKLVVEPGRVIAGNAGLLLMRVLAVKDNGPKRFVIVDAGMNDNLRPKLYKAWQRIVPVHDTGAAARTVDVVGPVCETGDFLALDRVLPAVSPGDLLAMLSAGAYGFSMTSNYNGRPRPPEVMVHGDSWTLIREREPLERLWQGEHLLPHAQASARDEDALSD